MQFDHLKVTLKHIEIATIVFVKSQWLSKFFTRFLFNEDGSLVLIAKYLYLYISNQKMESLVWWWS